MAVLNRQCAMKTKKEELEFAIQLFNLLNRLIDIIFERYGDELLDYEYEFPRDDFLEDDCPF